MERINLAGQRFGKLVAIEDAGYAKHGSRVWVCKCDCGNLANIPATKLTTGKTKSCGCYRSEIKITHNKSKTHLFKTWINMKQRCFNPKMPNYHRYGGRGITVCDEWMDFQNFYDWSITNGYDEKADKKEHTLDRIDNDGNYTPNNCRWVSSKENTMNRDCTRIAEIDGKKYTLRELAEEYNLSYALVSGRWNYGKRGKDLVKAVDTIRYPRASSDKKEFATNHNG